MLPSRPAAFILLGRFGDLAQMLPCWKAIFDRTGHKPVVIVTREYATILDGVTYVEPYPFDGHWWQDVPKARRIAQEAFGGGIVAQWWNDDPERIQLLEAATKGGLVLQSHGHEWGVDMHKWPDYGTSMADRCGFGREEWMSLPLVFDKRNTMREQDLVKRVFGGDPRPKLLYNFNGISSPFAFVPDILNPLMTRYGSDFHLVDLGKVHAERVFDLVALYERAVGLITSDTLTLHLAPATKIPYIAYTVGGWTRSQPRGNCVLEITYNHTPQRVEEALAVVESWKQK